MKRNIKLALAELEQEMEVIQKQDLEKYKGGNSSGGSGNQEDFNGLSGIKTIDEVVIDAPDSALLDFYMRMYGEFYLKSLQDSSGMTNFDPALLGSSGSSGDNNTGGGSGGINMDNINGILERPNFKELIWLFTNTSFTDRKKMIENKNMASAYGKGDNGGVYDALRHALWSALDAADIGLDRARQFHTLHETSNPGQDNAMDLHNNEWGFNWYTIYGDPTNNINKFVEDFNKAVRNKEIMILKK